MRVKLSCVCLLITGLLLLPACKSENTKKQTGGASTKATPPDPLTGTWSGDWGLSADARNTVTLELKWDGTALTGTINPGPEAVNLARASFNPTTSAVTMEADAKGRGGAVVHFTIEGKVAGTTMTGTWSHDDRKGDFNITKG